VPRANKLPTRRTYLKTISTGVALTALAGCSEGDGGDGSDGSDGSNGSDGSSTNGGTREATLTHIAHGGSTQEGEMMMMRKWADQHDADITIQGQSVANNVEIMSAIAENPDSYDTSSAMSTNGIALHDLQFDGNIFAEIDESRVPTYQENIKDEWKSERNPMMKDNPWSFMGYISSQGLAYQDSAFDEPPASWDFVKSEEFKGETSHFNHGITRFVSCSLAAGINPVEALNDDDLYSQVWDEAAEQHEYVNTYWGTGDELMRLYREGAVTVGEGWGGRINVLQQDGVNVSYTVPEEGSYPGGAGWNIVKASDNKDLIYDFLNWLYRRENIIELNTTFGYPYPLVDPPEEITSLPDYLESPTAFPDIDIRNVIPEIGRLQESFTKIKSS